MLVTPLSAIALANAFELSSTLKPVRSTACAPVLVTSNQSAPYGLLPLLHGETSETISDAGAGAAVTVTVSGALVASGRGADRDVVDGDGRRVAAGQRVPAFRYRPSRRPRTPRRRR